MVACPNRGRLEPLIERLEFVSGGREGGYNPLIPAPHTSSMAFPRFHLAIHGDPSICRVVPRPLAGVGCSHQPAIETRTAEGGEGDGANGMITG